MSSLYSGGTSREDEEQKYVDPVMVFDNVYENPSEPYGAYKFYMAPREEFVIQSEPHLYPVRAVYKEDDDRTSGYAISGGSSTLRDGSSKRILLCVLLIFLLIGAVIAAVVMAVLSKLSLPCCKYFSQKTKLTPPPKKNAPKPPKNSKQNKTKNEIKFKNMKQKQNKKA